MSEAENAWWSSLRDDDQLNNAYGIPHYDVGAVGTFVVDQLQLRRHHVVLDIGCGPGRLARNVITRSGCTLVGFDVAPSMIAAAKKGGLGTYFVSDGVSIPVDGPYDAAYAVTVFQHIPHSVVRGYMTQTLERLVPGGRLLFSYADGDEDAFLSHQATSANMMAWLYEAGFGNVRKIPTPTDHPAWCWMIAEAPGLSSAAADGPDRKDPT